ncbi:14012_t:CDS:1, partial [Entrophospora sp. SA101]
APFLTISDWVDICEQSLQLPKGKPSDKTLEPYQILMNLSLTGFSPQPIAYSYPRLLSTFKLGFNLSIQE